MLTQERVLILSSLAQELQLKQGNKNACDAMTYVASFHVTWVKCDHFSRPIGFRTVYFVWFCSNNLKFKLIL